MTATIPSSDPREQRRRLYHEADVVVVGAGVFGCAAAFALARQGRSVILLERWLKEPDRIVGELLQPGGVSALEKLGLGHCLEGIDAIKVRGYEVIYYGQPVNIPYPENAGKAIKGGMGMNGSANEKSSRPVGWSFHHGKFISKLREACAAEPNITIFETTVTGTITSNDSPQVLGVTAQTVDPNSGEKVPDYYFGLLTIVADGYASIFRKQYINRTPVVKSKFYGLELIDCQLPSPNHGHVVLSSASPVLLYQIGTHETRALIDVPENHPAATPAAGGIRNYLQNVALPALPKEVQPSFIAALEKTKLPRSMPNSWLPPSQQSTPGVIVLGDAHNMRHPLTGGGMTVAFSDALLLSKVLSPEKIPTFADSGAVCKAMKSFHWQRKGMTSIVNILAQALYSLFAAEDRQLAVLQKGCFRYFQRGGQCIDGPVGLLGGIIERPIVLVYHFYSVAALSIWLLIAEGGLLKLPLKMIEGIQVFWKACVVILPFIFAEMKW